MRVQDDGSFNSEKKSSLESVSRMVWRLMRGARDPGENLPNGLRASCAEYCSERCCIVEPNMVKISWNDASAFVKLGREVWRTEESRSMVSLVIWGMRSEEKRESRLTER